MSALYLHGRSLISALGSDLQQAAMTLAQGGVKPRPTPLPGGTQWPYFAIDTPHAPWLQRAQALLCAAIAQAGLEQQRDLPLFIASSSLQMGAIEVGELSLGEDYHCFAEEVASWLDWRGPIYLISTACTSSLHALLAAAALLRSGAAADAVVLAVELVNRYTLAGFAAMQLLSPDTPRPLGATRNGLVLGEAVSALHLSTAPSRWRLRGGASLVDGRDPTGARAESVAQLCRAALADSGLSAEQIDLVKVQAAGSPANDLNEVVGLQETFGRVPPLLSLKGMIGHTLGASGTAELALLLECLEQGHWPAVDYPLDPAAGATLAMTRPARVEHLLALILGFGGGYAAVALEDSHG
ncbi:MAG TPA: beta-ketoacyl synthase N-terminal-like domain-containing protein [Gammaproteobacteria bacterium]